MLNIKPRRSERVRTELCGLDFVGGFRYYEGVRYFDSRLDADRFREALMTMVDKYPLLAGTLVREGGRLFLDSDGPGVSYAEEVVDAPCPDFGPGIPQVNQHRLFLPKPTMPMAPGAPPQPPYGKPMLLHKLTRFADGRFALAGTTCHALCDATAIGISFDDCYRHYAGLPLGGEPVFSRESLVSIGDVGATEPSAKSGLTVGETTPATIRFRYFNPQYFSIRISIAQVQAGRSVVSALQAKGVQVSWNDLLHALVLKTFAETLPPGQTDVAANLAYDVRRMKGLSSPQNYCGNAVLHRWLRLGRERAADSSWADLASLFADFGAPDPDSARQDIGFLHREYLAGRFNDLGLLTHVQPPLGHGSIIINNLSAARHTQQDFGGLALWTDLAINEPLPVRMAILYPDPHGGLAMLLILSPEQVQQFREAWNRNAHALLGTPAGQ
jgi:hypothetical protein